jgi:23S rRNA pseudouridine1911/1915/1917 synthase
MSASTLIHHDCKMPIDYKGYRLDQALAKLFPQYSRSRLKEWIQQGCIQINNQQWKPRDLIQGNEHIQIQAELEDETYLEPEAIELNIIYEDPDILVINKPVGLVVHPGAGNREHTLLNALLHHSPQVAVLPRGGLIHRLDKDTSGLLIIAKTLSAYTQLVKDLQERLITREYQAIVTGLLNSNGKINAPIGRHPKLRTHMAIVEKGKPAVTHYRILENFQHYTSIQLKLESGRTHQIRVHMASIHHAIVGDQIYGHLQLPQKASLLFIQTLKTFKRQALHAVQLTFMHPILKTSMTFNAPLPDDMTHLLDILRKEDK